MKKSENISEDVIEKLKGNCVLVVPGGSYQIGLFGKIRKRGLLVACADRSRDCPASIAADGFFHVGLDEREELLKLARQIQPVAIVTDQTDAAVGVVAWLADTLGLRGIGVEVSALFTQKHLMREFGLKHGFPTPAFRVCRTIEESLPAAREIGYPVIIKPVDSQSSKGVYRVDNDDDLFARFNGSKTLSNRGLVLVEQFLDGVEFTVEGFMCRGGHKSLAISQKRHYSGSSMVACALEYGPISDRFDYDELRCQNDRWVNLSGLPFGITHAEYKFANGQFNLIEIAARGGGTQISSAIVPLISGVDVQDLLLENLLSDCAEVVTSHVKTSHALLEFFCLPDGRVTSVEGVDFAKSIDGVIDVVVHRNPGDVCARVGDDTGRPGYFIVCGTNEAGLAKRRLHVLSTVRIRVDA